MQPIVRQLQEIDHQKAADIFYEVFGLDGVGEKWTKEASLAHIKENTLSSTYNFCVEKEGNMVGIIIAFPVTREEGVDLFIDTVAVINSEQRNGIGKMLWEKVEKLAKENKLNGIRLLANPNLSSFQWYKKMQLNETGWIELYTPFRD
ncbi:MAG TPA: GNAT family N-acetyltransferase [Patescibacteria group bacterium]|nr:GNAT family N-acetyltransferase [Patescibacteria group bacterium]